MTDEMTIERSLRLIAGTLVLLSVALGYWGNPLWFLLTAFVGANLFQSGITNWCPMMTFLRMAGVSESSRPNSTPGDRGQAGSPRR